MSEEQFLYEVVTTSRSRWMATYTEGLKESQTTTNPQDEERTQNQYMCEECVAGVSGEKVTEKGINV